MRRYVQKQVTIEASRVTEATTVDGQACPAGHYIVRSRSAGGAERTVVMDPVQFKNTYEPIDEQDDRPFTLELDPPLDRYVPRDMLVFARKLTDTVMINGESFPPGTYFVERWGTSFGHTGWIRTHLSAEEFERQFVRIASGPGEADLVRPASCTVRRAS